MAMKTYVINFFGGPGTGKSTMASAIFSKLKFKNYNCELIQEFAKELVWENRMSTFEDELYIFAKQYHRVQRLNNKVQFIITDSPLLMKLNYIDPNNDVFKHLVLKESKKYHNLNFFLKRLKPYNQAGRNQTEEESKKYDGKIYEILEDHGGIFYTFDSIEESVEEIFNKIITLSGLPGEE